MKTNYLKNYEDAKEILRSMDDCQVRMFANYMLGYNGDRVHDVIVDTMKAFKGADQ